MQKNPETLNARRSYVKQVIRERPPGCKMDNVVDELAKELFLSTAVIFRDYYEPDPPADHSDKIKQRVAVFNYKEINRY